MAKFGFQKTFDCPTKPEVEFRSHSHTLNYERNWVVKCHNFYLKIGVGESLWFPALGFGGSDTWKIKSIEGEEQFSSGIEKYTHFSFIIFVYLLFIFSTIIFLFWRLNATRISYGLIETLLYTFTFVFVLNQLITMAYIVLFMI